MAQIVNPLSDVTREIQRVDATGSLADPAPKAAVYDDDWAPGGTVINPAGAWPAPDVSTQMERPLHIARQCTRSACAESAAVTLAYNYALQKVWIDVLLSEREPHVYELCERHADRLSVPHGWHLEDRRHLRDEWPVGLIAV